MLKSMTAYARASVSKKIGHFTVEIQSVNRKFLEVTTQLPSQFFRFEGAIKKWIGESIARGHLFVRLFVESEVETPVTVKPNIPLARQLKSAWDLILKELNISAPFNPELLIQEKHLLLYGEEFLNEEEYLEAIKEVLFIALDGLLKMKIAEGRALFEDIERRLHSLTLCIQKIERLSPESLVKQREKLTQKIEEALPGVLENQERILREVCLFAERVDIVEEIVRFKFHIKQFSDLLNSANGTIGKTLEFLIQEINRETNTIGSKSPHVEISKLVVEIKSELERIREQIQNVE